jgi:hypothetical protein
MTAVVIVEGIVILLLLVLVAGLLKSHAEILRQLHRLGATEDDVGAVGAPTHRNTGLTTVPTTRITGVATSGAARVITLDHERGTTLLAFLSSGCASCQVFWTDLSRPHDLPTPDTRVVIVTQGAQHESPSRIAELAPNGIPLVMSDDAWDAFRVPVSPYFLLADGDGNVIGEGSAANWGRLTKMLRRSIADSRHPASLDTEERGQFTDARLEQSGIEPGDPSLRENPFG